ncbi:hypothetical protein [Nocardiopsis sp. MG754419]|nr:hypothetical protein [Nocardiopsis sp. MG754419]
MNTDIEDFLVAPLYDHDDGLAAGIDAAAETITARVDAWAEEVRL